MATPRNFLRHWDHINISLMSSSSPTVHNFSTKAWKIRYYLRVSVLAKGVDDIGLFQVYFPHFALSTQVWVLYPTVWSFPKNPHSWKYFSTHFSPSTLVLVCFKIYYFIVSCEFKEAEWQKIILESKNHDSENVSSSQHHTESRLESTWLYFSNPQMAGYPFQRP